MRDGAGCAKAAILLIAAGRIMVIATQAPISVSALKAELRPSPSTAAASAAQNRP